MPCACAFVIALVWTVPASAGTYYVAKNGSDANTCELAQSDAAPKQTITDALTCLSAGDTLLVRAGTYDEVLTNPAMYGDSWDNPIRVAAFPSETVWLAPSDTDSNAVAIRMHTGQYVEFDGINVDMTASGGSSMVVACDEISDAHHIRVKNATWTGQYVGVFLTAKIPGCIGSNEFIDLIQRDGWHAFSTPGGLPGQGFYIQSSNNLLDRVEVDNCCGGSAFQVYNQDYDVAGPVSGTIIRNSKFHDIATSADTVRYWGGMIANGAVGTQYYNNVVYNIGGAEGSIGLLLFGGSDGPFIANNTIYGGAGVGFQIESNITNTTFRNNVSYANVLGDYYNGAGPQTTESNNLTSTTDPQFVILAPVTSA